MISSQFENQINEMIIDDEISNPCYKYTFQTLGYHTIIFMMNLNTNSLNSMFSNVYNMTSIIFNKYFNTENITNMGYMFSRCYKLTSIDISNFDTKNVVYMDYMFFFCEDLTSLEISNFQTTKVTNMEAMFCECSLPIYNF